MVKSWRIQSNSFEGPVNVEFVLNKAMKPILIASGNERKVKGDTILFCFTFSELGSVAHKTIRLTEFGVTDEEMLMCQLIREFTFYGELRFNRFW